MARETLRFSREELHNIREAAAEQGRASVRRRARAILTHPRASECDELADLAEMLTLYTDIPAEQAIDMLLRTIVPQETLRH